MTDISKALSSITTTVDPDQGQYTRVDLGLLPWLGNRESSESVQYLAQLRILSTVDANIIARQIGAIANGALLRNMGAGYLIIPNHDCQIRRNLMNLGDKALKLFINDPECVKEFTKHLRSSVNVHLEPMPAIEINDQLADMNYVVIKVIPFLDAQPTFDKRLESQEWRLSTFHFNENDHKDHSWQTHNADKEQSVKLFKRVLFFDTNTKELDLPGPESESGKAKKPPYIMERFCEFQPESLQRFFTFLVETLLSKNLEERILATRTLSGMKSIWGDARQQIAQLLFGMLADEQPAIVAAIQALSKIGNERIYYLLWHLYKFFENDEEIQREVVLALGELSPGSHEIPRLLELWRFDEDRNIVRFNQAITSIYQRFGLTRYLPECRTTFNEHLIRHNFLSALEILTTDGPNICLSLVIRNAVETILRALIMRTKAQFSQAAELLKGYNTLHNDIANYEYERLYEKLYEKIDLQLFQQVSELNEEIDLLLSRQVSELNTLVENLKPQELELASVVLNAEMTIYSDQAQGFSQSVYNYVDSAIRYLVEFVGVDVLKKDKDGYYINKSWIDAHPVIASIVNNTPKRSIKGKLHRHLGVTVVKAVVEKGVTTQAIESARLEKIEEIVETLEGLIQKRNDSIAGHGLTILSTTDVEQEFGSLAEIWHQLFELFEQITQKSCEISRYLDINHDIKLLLARADTCPLTIRDVADLYPLSSDSDKVR